VRDISHLFRPGHLQQLRDIVEDADASENDRFVAHEMLKNANVAAGGVLPSCQDTGTCDRDRQEGRERLHRSERRGTALGRRLRRVHEVEPPLFADGAARDVPGEEHRDEPAGAGRALRVPGDHYDFLFVTKGGGSANKTFLYQQTPAVLNEKSLLEFLDQQIRSLGTACVPAVPPGDRDRRLVGRVDAQDREARDVPLPRHAAEKRKRVGPRVSRHGNGDEDSSASRARPASVRSSAASTSPMTSAWSGCRATVLVSDRDRRVVLC
jgi:hypothetical protein